MHSPNLTRMLLHCLPLLAGLPSLLAAARTRLDLGTAAGRASWTVRAGELGPIPATVPGGVYTDLQAAGEIGDIYYRFNDLEYRLALRYITGFCFQNR